MIFGDHKKHVSTLTILPADRKRHCRSLFLTASNIVEAIFPKFQAKLGMFGLLSEKKDSFAWFCLTLESLATLLVLVENLLAKNTIVP